MATDRCAVARIAVHLQNARLTHSALTAHDATGRNLIATDRLGRLRWATPQASALLARRARGRAILAPVNDIIGAIAKGDQGGLKIDLAIGEQNATIAYVGTYGDDEYFFRISESSPGGETATLQKELGLTPREADVLLWIAHGKSNRDISEILNISARTVNKHLEQIFVKLGVENRAAAASIATRKLTLHQ